MKFSDVKDKIEGAIREKLQTAYPYHYSDNDFFIVEKFYALNGYNSVTDGSLDGDVCHIPLIAVFQKSTCEVKFFAIKALLPELFKVDEKKVVNFKDWVFNHFKGKKK